MKSRTTKDTTGVLETAEPGEATLRPRATASAAAVRVLVCGDHFLYRAGLRTIVESSPEFRVVAESTTDVASVVAALHPDVDLVLIDFDLIDIADDILANFEAVLQRIAPRPSVIVSSALDAHPCHAAVRLGIAGIVLKEKGPQTLLDALQSAARGQVWLERTLLTEMLAESSHRRRVMCAEQDRIDQLTPREREIIRVASTGLTNRQIADKLAISETTVRHHLGSIFAKLRVSSRSGLVVYAYRHNLASLDDMA